MKVPVRKLKALVQYSVLGGLVVTVVFVFANFKDVEKVKKTSDDPEEEVMIIMMMMMMMMMMIGVGESEATKRGKQRQSGGRGDPPEVTKQECRTGAHPGGLTGNTISGLIILHPGDSQPDSDAMVDWHNYTLIQAEKERVGPGEQGKPLVISKEEEGSHDSLFRSNGFSGYASDLISVSP